MILVLSLFSALPAQAETFTNEWANVTLHASTTLYADVVKGEYLRWEGEGVLDVFKANGTNVTLSPGTYLYADVDGTWTFYLSDSQDGPWDLSVLRAGTYEEETGRVFSTAWSVGTVNAGNDFDQIFYVPVPVNTAEVDFGDDSSGQLMKLELQGVYGEDIFLMANISGLPETPFQSATSSSANRPAPELRLYLSRPAAGTNLSPSYPPVSTKETLKVDYINDACEAVVLDDVAAQLSFSTPLYGMGGFACDIDGDGQMDPSMSSGDILGGARATPKTLSWSWTGEAAAGGFVEPGSYTCAGGVFVGGVHALLKGATAADPGVRWFQVVDYEAKGVPIYWNDALVTDTIPTSSGLVGDTYSGPYGVNTKSLEDASIVNGTAHGWGHRKEQESRGTYAWIDTWTVGTVYSAGDVELVVLSGERDADKDGLSNQEECSSYGSSPFLTDTDGGSVDDAAEIRNGTDPNDPDDDLSGVENPQDSGIDNDTGSDKDVQTPTRGDFQGGALGCTAAPRPTPAAPAVGGLVGLALSLASLRRHRRTAA